MILDAHYHSENAKEEFLKNMQEGKNHKVVCKHEETHGSQGHVCSSHHHRDTVVSTSLDGT